MRVLIDGQEVPVQNDVKIIHEEICLGASESGDGEEIVGDLHLTLTHEGLITETFVNGEVYKTASTDVEDLTEMCF